MLPGFGRYDHLAPGGPGIEQVMQAAGFERLLAFAYTDWDEFLICPVTRNRVLIYARIGREIERMSEVTELEEQWNPLGVRG